MIQITYDLRKLLLGLFVQVAHGDTSSKNSIVGVSDGHVSSGFGCLFVYLFYSLALHKEFFPMMQRDDCPRTNQVIQLDCGDPLVYPRDDLLRNGRCVYMIAVQSVTKSRHTGSDLIKLDTLLAAICRD